MLRPWQLALILCPALALAGPSFESGQQRNQLIELYTSEGCSSCPRADRRLGTLLEDPQLWTRRIPIALHVDYWDDLGWPDAYADAAHSARQRAHQRAGRLSQVYTPGFVIDGAEWRGFFLALGWPDPPAELGGRLRARLEGQALRVDYRPPGNDSRALRARWALLATGVERAIGGGENRGRRLQHEFVAIAHGELPLADGADGRLHGVGELPPAAERGGAGLALSVWVEPVGEQRPLQATGGWLAPPPGG